MAAMATPNDNDTQDTETLDDFDLSAGALDDDLDADLAAAAELAAEGAEEEAGAAASAMNAATTGEFFFWFSRNGTRIPCPQILSMKKR